MADTLTDLIENKEITPYVYESLRTPTVSQVVNVALNGIAYVQCMGEMTFTVEAKILMHVNNEVDLYGAYKNAHLVRLVDDDNIYEGYITSIKLSNKKANGFYECTIKMQEEIKT